MIVFLVRGLWLMSLPVNVLNMYLPPEGAIFTRLYCKSEKIYLWR